MQDFYESINTLIVRGKIKSQLKKEKKLALLEVTIFFLFQVCSGHNQERRFLAWRVAVWLKCSSSFLFLLAASVRLFTMG